MEHFGNIIIAFNYFSENCILNLWEDSEYVSGFKCLNIRKFSQIWQGSESESGFNYGGVVNIPWFGVCQISAYANIVQDSEYAWI